MRTAAFAIPGGLGAQETAILLIGSHLGLSPGTAIALALVKRVQEFIVCAPGLIAWWYSERSAGARRPGDGGNAAVRGRRLSTQDVDLDAGRPDPICGQAGPQGSVAEP